MDPYLKTVAPGFEWNPCRELRQPHTRTLTEKDSQLFAQGRKKMVSCPPTLTLLTSIAEYRRRHRAKCANVFHKSSSGHGMLAAPADDHTRVRERITYGLERSYIAVTIRFKRPVECDNLP